MDRPVVAVVLAGGTGTRLYPASRSDRPKQFLPLAGEESLLARTVARADFADVVVVSTRPAYAEAVAEHAPDARVVVEPAAKDTGPAVLYATHRARELAVEADPDAPDPVVVCIPADHHVPDADAFRTTMRRGVRVADRTGTPVVFGVEPTRPATGYGYVEPGADRGDYRELAAFHEKPAAETAARYVEAGYRWNAGIFAWTPAALFEAARGTELDPLVAALEDGDPERGFAAVPPVSVDHAVMERAEGAAVVPADFAWDDLGTWDALARVLDADADGNAIASDALTLDAADNVVASDDKHVSVVGLEDLCVVAWDDRVLVVPKTDAERVRTVVDRLKERGAF